LTVVVAASLPEKENDKEAHAPFALIILMVKYSDIVVISLPQEHFFQANRQQSPSKTGINR